MTTGKLVHTRPFFGNNAYGVVLLIILLSCGNGLYAQVRVTGHVFAEIVEPTALSSKAYNSHFIEGAGTTAMNELVLAEVKLSGGPNMDIGVAVTTSNLVAANGEILPLDAYACPGCAEDKSKTITGVKQFTLKATPRESIRQKKNATYNGRYSVVFMYN